MKSIAYVIPYFGKFPKGFELFLMSCKNNPTIDWLIFTDDKTKYEYPENVKVFYDTFEEIKKRVQQNFDFEIVLDKPYKFCDYKPAYGEIFHEELKNYDFWGMCDLDLAWGDIRKFITDEILEKYERIGFLGHSTIFKNVPEVNARYRTMIDENNYKKVYTTEGAFAFDEVGMDAIYEKLNIKYYHEIIFANLKKYDYGFFLDLMPEEDTQKNEHQVFVLKDGTLTRNYVRNHKIFTEDFMYIHFWCRPMTYKPVVYDNHKTYVMYADEVEELKEEITVDYIMKHSKRNKIRYYAKSIWFNRKKLTLKRILFNVKGMFNYKRKIK